MRSRAGAAIVACAVAAVAGAVAIGATLLWRSHERSLAAAGETAKHLAHSVEQHSHLTILQVEATLIGFARAMAEELQGHRIDGPEVRRALVRMVQQTFPLRDLMIVDADGQVLNSAGAGPRRVEGGMRLGDAAAEAAESGVAAPSLDRLFASPRSGAWSLGFLLPIGVGSPPHRLVAEVPVQAFTDHFSSINVHPGASIALLHESGKLIAREPHIERLVGQIHYDPEWMAERVRGPDGALLQPRDDPSGRRGVLSLRRVPARPLVVAASIEESAALERWYQEVAIFATLMLGFACATAAIATGFVLLVRRRERAEKAERALRERLARAIEAMPDAFVLFDPGDRLVLSNSKYVAFFPHLRDIAEPGVTFGEILDRAATHAPLVADDRPRPDWRAWRLQQHRSPSGSFEQQLAGERYYHTIEQRLPDGHTVMVVRDISELKRALLEARRAKESAESASRLKSAFLANMSHELRTPLNAVLGFSELIREGLVQDPAKRAEYAGDIHSAGSHLLKIINDVLDLSKIESGTMTLKESELDLADLLRSCQALLRPKADDGGVALDLQLPPDLPPVYGDEVRLKQIALNLLSNAVKFTPPGGRVELAVRGAADGGLRIEVRDTGIGMSPEDIPVALQDFGQIDSSLARRFEGTGLGLPLAKRLIELHGGTLEIRSAPGQGTTVSAGLPAARMMARVERLSA